MPLAKLSWCQRWRQPLSHHSVNTPSISPANHLQQHNCGRQITGGFITPAPVLPRHSVPTSSQYSSSKGVQRASPARPSDFTLCCKTSLRRYILGEPALIRVPTEHQLEAAEPPPRRTRPHRHLVLALTALLSVSTGICVPGWHMCGFWTSLPASPGPLRGML